MPTAYSHRLFIFVEVGKINAANNQAAAWDPDVGGADTFGPARLSPSGDEPATYVATNTAATDTMKAGIEQAFSVVPFAAVYRASDGWTWESALADMGLVMIEPEV